jgi:hypothetical protein
MVEKNLDLTFEFEKYVLDHPHLADRIPRNAVVSVRLEGDERFNRWSRRLAETQRKGRQLVFCITIGKMRPVRSRIEELRIERAA